MKRVDPALIAIVLIAAGIRIAGISSQTPTGDDAGVVQTAFRYVLHGQPAPTMSFHPNLRNLLVYASVQLLGSGAWGVKGWSMLFGTLSVPLLAAIVQQLTRNRLASRLAALFLAIDIVHIDYSRQAIQEVHTAFFFLLGTWLALRALTAESTRPWRHLLPLSGVAFGLGIASKWHAIVPLAASLGLLGYEAWKRRRWPELVYVAASLIGIPLLVYLLTYVPWFTRGYGFGDWVAYQRALQHSMAMHSKTLAGWTLYNRPWQWFVRPFMAEVDVAGRLATSQVSVAVGNPLVWLAVLPAVMISLIRHWRSQAHVVLNIYFWTAYLPLATSPRPIWILSSIAVTPYAFAILGLVLAEVATGWRRGWVYAYVAACIAGSALLYPLAIGRSLDYPYLQPLVTIATHPAERDSLPR